MVSSVARRLLITFQSVDSRKQLRQLSNEDLQPQLFAMRLRRASADERVVRDIAPNLAVPADRNVGTDGDVSPEHRRAADAQRSPMRQLCPIWTRLSIFVPLPIRVVPVWARSMHVFAPISTSSPTSTLPICGIFRNAPSTQT